MKKFGLSNLTIELGPSNGPAAVITPPGMSNPNFFNKSSSAAVVTPDAVTPVVMDPTGTSSIKFDPIDYKTILRAFEIDGLITHDNLIADTSTIPNVQEIVGQPKNHTIGRLRSVVYIFKHPSTGNEIVVKKYSINVQYPDPEILRQTKEFLAQIVVTEFYYQKKAYEYFTANPVINPAINPTIKKEIKVSVPNPIDIYLDGLESNTDPSVYISMEYIPHITSIKVPHELREIVQEELLKAKMYHNDILDLPGFGNNLLYKDTNINEVVLIDFGAASHKRAPPMGGKKRTKRTKSTKRKNQKNQKSKKYRR